MLISTLPKRKTALSCLRYLRVITTQLIVVALTLCCMKSAFCSDDLVEPNKSFVLTEQESQFIKSLEPLKVMIDDNFVPLSFYDAKTDTSRGISVDLFKHIAARLGIRYQLNHDKSLTWADKVELFKQRKVDLLMPVSITPERAVAGVFTTGFYDTYYGAVAKKPLYLKLTKSTDLTAYKIGVTKASAIIPFIQPIVPAGKIFIFDNQKDLYKAVRSGQVDIALQNKLVFQEDHFNMGFVDLSLIYTISEYPRTYTYYLGKTESLTRLSEIINRYMAGVDSSRLVASYELGEDELIQRYSEQSQQKKMLVWGIICALLLLVLLGIAYLNHRRLSRKLAESLEQLRESEERFRLLMVNIPGVAVQGYALDSTVLFWNRASELLYGYSAKEALVANLLDLIIPKEMKEGVTVAVRQMKETGVPIPASELLLKRKDGSRIPVYSSHAIVTPVGRQPELFCLDVDLSEQKIAENKLKYSMSLTNATLESTVDGILVVDRDGKIVRWNQKFIDLWRVPEELVVTDVKDPVLEYAVSQVTKPEQFLRKVMDLYEHPEASSQDLIEIKDGRIFDRYSQPLTIGNEIVGRLWAFRDITERVKAEEQIRDAKNYIQTILASSPVGIETYKATGETVSANEAVAHIVGATTEQLLPQNFRNLESWKQSGMVVIADHALSSRENQRGEFRVTTTFGKEVDLDCLFVPFVFGSEQHLALMIMDITERKRAEKCLIRAEKKFRQFFEFSVDPSLLIINKNFVDCNQAAVEMLHAESKNDVLNKHPSELSPEFQPDGRLSAAKAEELITETIRKGSNHFEWLHCRVDGEIFPVEVSLTLIEDEGEAILFTVWRDITERKQAEADLRISATAFESQEGMVVTDANANILRVNHAFTEISGYTEEEVLGKNPRILKSDRHNAEFYKEMWEIINRTGGWQGEIWDKRKNGEEYPKWLTISAVNDIEGKVTNYIGAHYDITERKKAEEKINELAFFDQLTGLPNRTLLLDRLKQTMTTSSRTGSYCALLFLDLDDFKTLNDILGHEMGDELLKQVSQRLTTCVRAGDTSARLGGDEFVMILTNLSMDKRAAASQTKIIGEKIIAVLNQSYNLQDVTYHNTPSIGATLFCGDQAEIEDLLRQADMAMYKAKDAGRNTIRFFDPDTETAVKKRAALEKDLRNAVHKNQFLLHYQAQIAGGRLTGSEVLVRWQHPERGMVSPADFIPLAEESRLILPLGQWVLETACRQLARWEARPDMSHLTVAVNVSARQFHQADFVDQVLDVLNKTGANPQLLKLELTESLLVSNVEDIIEKMNGLKVKGVGFSLDDFGTGYSSLSYLKRLPLDQLKIDQSFVRDVLTDSNDAAIAKTVIVLGQSLGLNVIAEGVETADQRDFLADSGCHAYQGYFYSRPLPLESFEEFAKRV